MSIITREFTKEQLIEQAKSSIERYSKAVAGFPRHMNVAMELKLARIALASLEAEAMHQVYDESGGWFDVDSSDAAGEVEDGNPIRVLYTAPPALVVPVLKVDWQENEFSAGWNACHAATLQGKAEPRQVVRHEHAEWSQTTFGNVGPVGPLKHLSKEALEAAEEPDDLSEWADMQFLLWDAQRRAGITDEQITQAMIDKLAVNKSRQWPEPKDGEPRLHIKAAPKQENI